MTDAPTPTADDKPPERPRYRPLAKWERIVAVAAGVAIGVTGFVAMFVTKNEAGVAVAILLAGVLILLGIQGTPLTRLGAKDYSVEWIAREEVREEVVDRVLERAEQSPAEAEAILEGYQLADPSLLRDRKLMRALGSTLGMRSVDNIARVAEQMGWGVEKLARRNNAVADVLLQREGKSIAVEVRHYEPGRKADAETLRQVIETARAVGASAVLFVTNVPLTRQAATVITDETMPVHVVDNKGSERYLNDLMQTLVDLERDSSH